MRQRIGLAVLHLGWEVRWYRPSLHRELADHPAVLRARELEVVWRRGGRPVVWS